MSWLEFIRDEHAKITDPDRKKKTLKQLSSLWKKNGHTLKSKAKSKIPGTNMIKAFKNIVSKSAPRRSRRALLKKKPVSVATKKKFGAKRRKFKKEQKTETEEEEEEGQKQNTPTSNNIFTSPPAFRPRRPSELASLQQQPQQQSTIWDLFPSQLTKVPSDANKEQLLQQPPRTVPSPNNARHFQGRQTLERAPALRSESPIYNFAAPRSNEHIYNILQHGQPRSTPAPASLQLKKYSRQDDVSRKHFKPNEKSEARLLQPFAEAAKAQQQQQQQLQLHQEIWRSWAQPKTVPTSAKAQQQNSAPIPEYTTYNARQSRQLQQQQQLTSQSAPSSRRPLPSWPFLAQNYEPSPQKEQVPSSAKAQQQQQQQLTPRTPRTVLVPSSSALTNSARQLQQKPTSLVQQQLLPTDFESAFLVGLNNTQQPKPPSSARSNKKKNTPRPTSLLPSARRTPSSSARSEHTNNAPRQPQKQPVSSSIFNSPQTKLQQSTLTTRTPSSSAQSKTKKNTPRPTVIPRKPTPRNDKYDLPPPFVNTPQPPSSSAKPLSSARPKTPSSSRSELNNTSRPTLSARRTTPSSSAQSKHTNNAPRQPTPTPLRKFSAILNNTSRQKTAPLKTSTPSSSAKPLSSAPIGFTVPPEIALITRYKKNNTQPSARPNTQSFAQSTQRPTSALPSAYDKAPLYVNTPRQPTSLRKLSANNKSRQNTAPLTRTSSSSARPALSATQRKPPPAYLLPPPFNTPRTPNVNGTLGNVRNVKANPELLIGEEIKKFMRVKEKLLSKATEAKLSSGAMSKQQKASRRKEIADFSKNTTTTLQTRSLNQITAVLKKAEKTLNLILNPIQSTNTKISQQNQNILQTKRSRRPRKL